MKPIYVFISLMIFAACEEAPLFSGSYDELLNAPSTMTLFPTTGLALISNTNISLQESSGSMMAYDLATQTLLEDTRFFTTNFGAYPLIDESRNRILVPDFDQSLLLYSYQIPGDGGLAVSFSKEDVSPALSDSITNGIEMDEVPSDIKLVATQNHGDIYVVVNQMGTLTIVDADDLSVMDLNDEERYQGLRLSSTLTIEQTSNYPASGVSRLFHDTQSNLLFAASASSNFVYIFDPENLENEGMLSFLSVAGSTTGIRSVAIAPDQHAYFAHAGLESLIVVDISGITDNGISFEVIEPSIVAIIPLLGAPNEVILNPAADTLFVSLNQSNELVKIDVLTRSITDRITLSEGIGPGSLYYDAVLDDILSLNFISNSVTRVNATTLSEIEEIQ